MKQISRYEKENVQASQPEKSVPLSASKITVSLHYSANAVRSCHCALQTNLDEDEVALNFLSTRPPVYRPARTAGIHRVAKAVAQLCHK